jgi:Arc/MetJ-type ribon-helix-helix transcriptional regulator
MTTLAMVGCIKILDMPAPRMRSVRETRSEKRVSTAESRKISIELGARLSLIPIGLFLPHHSEARTLYMPSADESSPLTFDLKEELIQKIDTLRGAWGATSTSDVIRLALDRYDLSTYRPPERTHRQISVRLPARTKQELFRVARQRRVSVGELLRTALESLPVRSAKAGASTKTKPVEPMKKAAKKTAKKAPAKKAAKKKK